MMKQALSLARKGFEQGEVPVGAVIIDSKTDTLIASAHNLVETNYNPTAHAEILVIAQASEKLGTTKLIDCDLYVTLEPCPMCAQAIAFARIRRLYFGAYDTKGGGVVHGPCIFSSTSCHHQPEWYGGICEEESRQLLQDFFRQRR